MENIIRAGKGLSAVRVVFTSDVGGTTYVYPGWWGVDAEGYALAGPQTSERKLRHEIAQLRRLIARGEYAPR